MKLFLWIFILTLSSSLYAQPADTTVNIRGNYVYYVDGVRTYSKLTKADSTKILTDFVMQLNGCWRSDSSTVVQIFKLSKQNFTGTWFAEGIHSSAPLVRLEILNNQVKLINTDLIGGDSVPANISIYEDELRIYGRNDDGTYVFKRQKCK